MTNLCHRPAPRTSPGWGRCLRDCRAPEHSRQLRCVRGQNPSMEPGLRSGLYSPREGLRCPLRCGSQARGSSGSPAVRQSQAAGVGHGEAFCHPPAVPCLAEVQLAPYSDANPPVFRSRLPEHTLVMKPAALSGYVNHSATTLMICNMFWGRMGLSQSSSAPRAGSLFSSEDR